MNVLQKLLANFKGTMSIAPVAVGVRGVNVMHFDCHCCSDDCSDCYNCDCTSDDCTDCFDCDCHSVD